MSQPKKRFGKSRDSLESNQKYALTDKDRQLTELAAENLPRNRHAEAFEKSIARDTSGSTSATADGTDELDVEKSKKALRKAAKRDRTGDPQPTPLWYKVIMIGLMIVGLLWIIVYYLFQGTLPIPGINVWNLIIGLVFMMTGLIMTTRWR
ncbi:MULTISPECIES: cell division protein CrgA [Kocuria]|uniref:Cell division protein CrgA n=1 Tax=Kocuria atrinae TaxID=592377 RepID=A0ABP5J562_9MICC|nr:cell division protein CrgA [Kocuria carniphila]MCT1801385.1 cell division protein CrgA [Kocuria carniphila]MDN5700443.1 cell division protein CrgA [Kocuria sp.]